MPIKGYKTRATASEIIPTEYQEACTFVDWLELQRQAGKVLDYCHIANESYGGTRADLLRGMKLKRQGRKKGVFDYQIFCMYPYFQHASFDPFGQPLPRIQGRVICVELKKRNGGTVSAEQKYWQEVYKTCGIPAKICHGADEAIEFVEGFIK